MSEKNNNEKEQDVRSIPTWTRRYAHHRTLPVVVFQLFLIAGSVLIGALSGLLFAYVISIGAWAVTVLIERYIDSCPNRKD